MNASQLWDNLIKEGSVPLNNIIELKNPLEIEVVHQKYSIIGVYKDNLGRAALIKASSTYYGRLAN